MSEAIKQEQIRNFCIIAHIDHGKSTLADRLIECTGTMRQEELVEQVMDSMELERERGITIKAKAIRLNYRAVDGNLYLLNLIDTPGHVDFSYEVSRTLAACDGAVLLIDATQGIQAQTLANVYAAMEHNLEIIPSLNKMDLPGADPERVMSEIKTVLGYGVDETLQISGKTGAGVDKLLETIISKIPPPSGISDAPMRAIIFDSYYDRYKGVIAYLRVIDGSIKQSDRLKFMATGTELEVIEVGYFNPHECPVESLKCGEVGYIATGLKQVGEAPVGDTLTSVSNSATTPLPGYRPAKPMVFAGIYPTLANDYSDLREAMEKLKLNDASLFYEMENSPLLGHGFRCGFLGLLHLDIVYERLEREFGLNLVVTAPGVKYLITKTNGEQITVVNPGEMPPQAQIMRMEEPWVKLSIITPARFIGPIMDLERECGGVHIHTEFIGMTMGSEENQRVRLDYEMPLRNMLTTFYDALKSRSKGYASLDYEFLGYRDTNLIKLDILVNDVLVDAFSRIVTPDQAQDVGRSLVHKLKSEIPKQLFVVPIQATVGGRIVARVDIGANRKDVLAKCYGGDITRKRKLLEKQKEGKEKMKRIGKVEVPKEVFLSVLKSDS
ncbi:MAG: translation elongation factor 4 [Dehalococcoidia bacterium]|nr:translation elongation factor 4 [Dehalococcoidia bacterium]